MWLITKYQPLIFINIYKLGRYSFNMLSIKKIVCVQYMLLNIRGNIIIIQ